MSRLTTGSYKIKSNILTDSSDDDIYIEVTYINEDKDGNIELNAIIPQFEVQTWDRDDDTTYDASFSFRVMLQEKE